MSQKMPPYSIRDFSLGLNDNDDPALIADNAAADVLNAVITKGPAPLRNGYVKYTPTALSQPITRLYQFFKNNGLKEILAVSNKTVYRDNNGALTAIPFSVITSLTTSETAQLTYKDRNLKDVVLIADGGKLKVYDCTNVKEVVPYAPTTQEQTDPGLNDLSNLTNFRAIAVKQDRIFALAHPTVKNRLSFCHHDFKLGYAAFDYWPATFFFDLVSEENDESITLRTFRDAIVVFNRRTIWILYGDGRTINDYKLHRVNVPSGCCAPESVCYVGNNLFYLSDDRKVYSLYSTDQNYISAEVVSTDKVTRSSVEKTLRNIPMADLQKAVGTFYDGRYWLSFPSGLTLVYDVDLRCWTKFSNIKANSFLTLDGVLYFTSNNGLIYRFDEKVFTDDGEMILYLLKTKNFDFGYPVQIKKYKRLWAVAKQYEGESSSFNVRALIDSIEVNLTDISTDLSGEWDEGDYDNVDWDFQDVVQIRRKIREKGFTIQFVITNNLIAEPLILYQINILYKLKKAK